MSCISDIHRSGGQGDETHAAPFAAVLLLLLMAWSSGCSSPVDSKWVRAGASPSDESKAEQECRDQARRSSSSKGLIDNAVERGAIEAECMKAQGYRLDSPAR